MASGPGRALLNQEHRVACGKRQHTGRTRFWLHLEIGFCTVGENTRCAGNAAETGENFRLPQLLPWLDFQEPILVFAQIISLVIFPELPPASSQATDQHFLTLVAQPVGVIRVLRSSRTMSA